MTPSGFLQQRDQSNVNININRMIYICCITCVVIVKLFCYSIFYIEKTQSGIKLSVAWIVDQPISLVVVGLVNDSCVVFVNDSCVVFVNDSCVSFGLIFHAGMLLTNCRSMLGLLSTLSITWMLLPCLGYSHLSLWPTQNKQLGLHFSRFIMHRNR